MQTDPGSGTVTPTISVIPKVGCQPHLSNPTIYAQTIEWNRRCSDQRKKTLYIYLNAYAT